MMRKLRLAILDMYENTPNQGMRCIREILDQYAKTLDCKVFDVRGKNEVPGLDFDIYISTGGPGSPLEGDGVWDKNYYNWMDSVFEWNKSDYPKKYVFFICHSFQMACAHLKLANITRRKSKAFGTFPVHLTQAGSYDPLFDGLPDPFYIADFREWQVVEPNEARFKELGAEIMCREKIRPHVNLERAIMAIRFSDEIFGTQFHPEADSDGMLLHFLDPERRQAIIEEHSEQKYLEMIDHLKDSDKICLTHDVILPTFLSHSINELCEAEMPV